MSRQICVTHVFAASGPFHAYALFAVNAMNLASNRIVLHNPDADWIKKSLLYQELKAAYDEILRHKWLESEKMGRDIGYDTALIDWNLKHGSLWRKGRQHRRFN